MLSVGSRCPVACRFLLAFAAGAVSSVAFAATLPNTVDLSLDNVLYDLTCHIPNPQGGEPRLFAVDVTVRSLTGRVQNNCYGFRVNLYRARQVSGMNCVDLLALAATGRFTLNHKGQPVGTTKRLGVPTPSTQKTVWRQPMAADFLLAELTEFTDISETGPSNNALAKRIVPTSSLSYRVQTSNRITLASNHESGKQDRAYASLNIKDAAEGRAAQRSSYKDGSLQAPGGQTELDARMLNGLFLLGVDYTLKVSEVAGGAHSSQSRHYKGLAFDVTHINGTRVSSGHPNLAGFKARAKSLGGAASLEATHVHVEWPKDPEVASTTSSK